MSKPKNNFVANVRVWKQIFKQIGLPKYGEILDLLPGYSPKVAIAASRYKFKGVITCVDYDSGAISALHKSAKGGHYHKYMPHINAPVQGVRGVGEDLVTGNHIIDDLVMGKLAEEYGLHGSIYKEKSLQQRIWTGLIMDPLKRRKYTEFVLESLNGVFSSVLPGRFIAISQYASSFEKNNGCTKRVEFCRDVFHELESHLVSRKNVSRSDLKKTAFENSEQEIYKPEHWLIVQKR